MDGAGDGAGNGAVDGADDGAADGAADGAGDGAADSASVCELVTLHKIYLLEINMFESGLSLIDSPFPRDKLICFPNLNDHMTVSCLTPNSTAAVWSIAWLKKN